MKLLPIIVLAAIAIYAGVQSRNKDLEITKLKKENAEFRQALGYAEELRQQTWIDSCNRAVNMTCMYAECAVTPIERIQEKLCRLSEEL